MIGIGILGSGGRMGTAIAAGSGRAVVVATGMATELGKIARLLATTKDDATPLQRRLEKVGRSLMLACLGVVVVVGLLGVARGATTSEVAPPTCSPGWTRTRGRRCRCCACSRHGSGDKRGFGPAPEPPSSA